jgi:hypothetical protein
MEVFAMPKSTDELLNILKKSSSLSSFLNEQNYELTEQIPLSIYLNDLLTQKHLKKSDIIRLSGLDRGYAYDIFSGAKNPARDKILALCFAFRLTDVETQKLLKSTGYPPLYIKITRDSIILYALQHHLSLSDVNELLYEHYFPCLV